MARAVCRQTACALEDIIPSSTASPVGSAKPSRQWTAIPCSFVGSQLEATFRIAPPVPDAVALMLELAISPTGERRRDGRRAFLGLFDVQAESGWPAPAAENLAKQVQVCMRSRSVLNVAWSIVFRCPALSPKRRSLPGRRGQARPDRHLAPERWSHCDSSPFPPVQTIFDHPPCNSCSASPGGGRTFASPWPIYRLNSRWPGLVSADGARPGSRRRCMWEGGFMAGPIRIAVMASGGGSNLQAIIERADRGIDGRFCAS